MRKLLLFILVAAFAASVPFTASAVEISTHGIGWTTFNFSKNVGNYAVFLSDDFNKDATPGNRTYTYTRFIPRIFLKFSDDLQYVYGFDTVVSIWGNDVADSSGGGGYGFGSYSFSGSNNQRTRWNYIDVRVPTTPLRVKLGIQSLADASNLVVLTGQFPSIRVDTPLGKGKLMAFWAKMSEGVENIDDDANFYGAQLKYPVTQNVSITPQWYYAHGDGAHTCDVCIATTVGYQGTDITWIGANVKGNLKTAAGPLSLSGNIFGATGNYDNTDSGGVKGSYSGFLFEGRATLDMGALKPGLIFLYSSGDKNLMDNDREVFPAINPYYGATNLFWVGFVNYYTAVTNSASGEYFRGIPGIASTANGITMIQGNVTLNPLKNVTVKPAISWFKSSEDWAGYTPPGSPMAIPNNDKSMGVEYGMELIYQVYKNLRWHTYIGAFDPGDFYQWVDGDADAADTAFMLKSSVAVLW